VAYKVTVIKIIVVILITIRTKPSSIITVCLNKKELVFWNLR